MTAARKLDPDAPNVVLSDREYDDLTRADTLRAIRRAERFVRRAAKRRPPLDPSPHEREVARLVEEGWAASGFRTEARALLETALGWTRSDSDDCVPRSVPDAWRFERVDLDGAPWFKLHLAEVNVTSWAPEEKWRELASVLDFYEIGFCVLVVDRNGTRSYPYEWAQP